MTLPRVILAYPKVDYEKNYPHSWMPFSVLSIAHTLRSEQIAEVVIFDGNLQNDKAWTELLEKSNDAICIGP